ncbi:uncharacterized protein PRCAT00006312001 [Priceomyces carsonii]|uniref:uncharacterized protein n=1 Tax=Priceomyces carsonii TaxID=28549 RepID=UPI002EDB0798|nr:unnamed protein product [Priceomyces carsonii]
MNILQHQSWRLMVVILGFMTYVESVVTNLPFQYTATEASQLSSQHSSFKAQDIIHKKENTHDKELLKFLVVNSIDNYYYDVMLRVGSRVQQLRIDLIQGDVWVMGMNDFLSCDEIYSWWSSEVSTGTTLPDLATTDAEYTASICAAGGVYSAESLSTDVTVPGVPDGEEYFVPYVDTIEAVGEFEKDDIHINSTNGLSVLLSNFTFLRAYQSSVFAGGLGLAGNPMGSGFLDSLVDKGYIVSPGYSLFFSNVILEEGSLGELIPGMVDKKYVDGDFYQFDMLNHTGSFFSNSVEQTALSKLRLPILNLDSIVLENEKNQRTYTLTSDDGSFPVLLDSRSLYTHLPLDTIIQIAIQTNAYYSNDTDRWIVECDTIAKANATFNFHFNDLKIKIPLHSFLLPANTGQDQNLTFSNGADACFLSILPSSHDGYSVLGLSFLVYVYLAVDNEGGKIALGNSNRELKIEVSDFSFSSVHTVSSTTFKNSSIEATHYSSIAYILSDTIPFATVATYSSTPTLTFSSMNNATALEVPAKFSGRVKNGHFIVGSSEKTIPGAESTEASSTKSKNSGSVLIRSEIRLSLKQPLGLILAVCLFMVAIILL